MIGIAEFAAALDAPRAPLVRLKKAPVRPGTVGTPALRHAWGPLRTALLVLAPGVVLGATMALVASDIRGTRSAGSASTEAGFGSRGQAPGEKTLTPSAPSVSKGATSASLNPTPSLNRWKSRSAVPAHATSPTGAPRRP